MSTLPPCLRCRTNRHVNQHGRDEFYCSRCDVLFDNDPDEGGTYSTFDPSRRLIREEERQQRAMTKRRFESYWRKKR